MDSILSPKNLDSQLRKLHFQFSDLISPLLGLDFQFVSLTFIPLLPPDVGNWFSSYKYQSPDPDTNFGFEESEFRGSNIQKNEEEKANFEIDKIQDEVVEDDKHNEKVCLTRSLDSFSSDSPLSEPLDIGNWFSSYAYESYVPDTYSMTKDVVSEESECEKERLDLEVINEDEDRSQNDHPKACFPHHSPSDENKRVEEPSRRGHNGTAVEKNLATTCTSHLENVLQPCIQDKTLKHNSNPKEYGETIRMNHGSVNCSRKAQIVPLDVKKSSGYRIQEMIQNNDIREAKSEAKIQHGTVDVSISLCKRSSGTSSTCTRNKENDGFISTRKDKCAKPNGENSWKKPEIVSLQCSTKTGTVPLACEKQAVKKRKALIDVTNVQQSNVIEITGKWKCPQKGKPYVGPALKQLRLEKWVHRVL
ncbi:uncharacterized protein LOC107640001 [Arachis ipaensis]|uniref:uncharacterized protein LOC107640001 n=1 Tax=Arachis ipaensis TaxID=130454 RepID=UPI000A2B7D8A|nr:uncharacterized protein LOC107640001 [Arachis ipaensis]